MNDISVSVLVPVYNTSQYLARCLDSLLAQTLCEIEIICVNDGSTDRSLEILRAYAAKDPRIRLVNQPNRGLPAARNAGLDLARGEYVGFVDSDDYAEHTMFERLYRAATESSSEVVICGAELFPTTPIPPLWMQKALSTHDAHYPTFDKDVLFKESCTRPFLWRTLIKRELLVREGIRLNESIVLGEDQALQFRIYPRARGIRIISDKLYHYCWHREGSIMATDRDLSARLNKHIDLCIHVFSDLREISFRNGMEKELLTWSVELLFYDFIKLPAAERKPLAHRILPLWNSYGREACRASLPPHINQMLDHFYCVARATPPQGAELSVIVHLSGGKEKLAALRESIDLQTQKNVEVIVLSSADYATYLVLRQWLLSDLRVRAVLIPPTTSKDAFTRGISMATAKTVLLADEGTRFSSPTDLEEQLSARRERTAHKRIDLDEVLTSPHPYGHLLEKTFLFSKEEPHLKLQQIMISPGEYPSLYFRGGSYSDGRILLKKDERLSFDTYFNCFNYQKYRDLTVLESISLHLSLSGKARVRLSTYNGKTERTLTETETNSDCVLSVSLSELPACAILYPVIEALEDTVLHGGEYFAEAETSAPDVAIAICTYRREEYLRNNLKILDRARIPHLSHVIVVDNGGTLTDADLTGENVTLVKNPNYGGSAGFTRGIMEARRAGHTHVILMDDDIVIYPEAIERMTVFLSLLRKEFGNAHLSAAMLPSSRLYLQHEKGALWNGSRIESLHTKLDVRERDALIENLSDGPIGYGAWWCFCLPLSDVDEFGLPLPLFIKFDDVEYGTRCCKDAPIVTMNGMAVAHADFDSKYNMHLEYYTIRNQLIMLAMHRMQNRFSCILRLMKVCAKHLFLYRYAAMPILLRAFRDFLRGADFLMETDAEALNREVMAMAPKAVELSALPDWDPALRENYVPSKKNFALLLVKVITLGGHLFPNFLLKRKLSAAPLPSVKVGDCYLHRHTVQYQIGSDSGYVFDKNSPKFFASIFRAAGMALRIFFTYGRAAKSYREKKSVLTSQEFWENYLGMDK